MEWVYGVLILALALGVCATGFCFSLSNGERYPDKAGRCCRVGQIFCVVLVVILALLKLFGL